ncbi:MAG: tetratricopeptide repeat protein [Holophagaceae bacterium]|nr:tetratricopeptide repeat protein [Holophagaceae bacterium]
MGKFHLVGFAIVGFFGLVGILGCNPNDQFVRMENEVNDLKVEIYRQRQEMQDLAKKTGQIENIVTAESTEGKKHRADTQESLRQLNEGIQGVRYRLESSTPQRTSSIASRPPAGQSVSPTTPPLALEPDQQLFAIAEKDYNAGKFQSAIESADNLIKHFPDSDNLPDALYIKGRALMATGAFKEAQDSFQKLCNEFPASVLFRQARLSVGRCQLNQGNTLAAISTFEQIVDRWPTSEEARRAAEILQDVKSSR